MDYRISKLRDYLTSIIESLTTNKKFQINADMLDSEPENYSLNKMPVQTEVEKWIIGNEICHDIYSFRSRKAYSTSAINNLQNIGFFEEFENKIKDNNEKGILPEIDGIQEIKCLNCGSLNIAESNTAVFDVQVEITYQK
jgi:hypothetical protein